jgi:hypothetical protein
VLFKNGYVAPIAAQFADGHQEPEQWEKYKNREPVRVNQSPLATRLIEKRAPVVSGEGGDEALLSQAIREQFGVKSCFNMPLIRRGKVVGMMNLDYLRSGCSFSEGQRAFAMTVASQIAMVLDNTKLYKQAKDQAAALASAAQRANELTNSCRQVGESGRKLVSDAVVGMGEIHDASSKITQITSVINGIASQTNLLALNAAVEAARAGEQGRGFAVVATEVRNLAQRCADAVKEIKLLIRESSEKVETGVTAVNKAGQTFQEIVTAVKGVADIVAEMATASQGSAGATAPTSSGSSTPSSVLPGDARSPSGTVELRRAQTLEPAVRSLAPHPLLAETLTYPCKSYRL